jgi:hypothetical protein
MKTHSCDLGGEGAFDTDRVGVISAVSQAWNTIAVPVDSSRIRVKFQCVILRKQVPNYDIAQASKAEVVGISQIPPLFAMREFRNGRQKNKAKTPCIMGKGRPENQKLKRSSKTLLRKPT